MRQTEHNEIRELAKSKAVAVFGRGKSGLAAAKLAEKCGLEPVFYAEDGNSETFDAKRAGEHALAVYSPGFRPDHPWLELARKAGAETLCEPDFASLAWRGKITAVTGTNGKTTLTSFLAHALGKCGVKAAAAGNIGTPFSEICADDGANTPESTAVCELSSFQTADSKKISPDALLWTNFAPDHLDWHADMREYFGAKLRTARRLKKNLFIAGESVRDYAAKLGFELPRFAVIVPENRYKGAPKPFDTSIQSRNYAAAEAYWREAGMDAELLEKSAADFKLPAYRFSEPTEAGGVFFYNDSKATNAHAAEAALDELAGRDVVWIGGGKDKNCELESLVSKLRQRARAAVLVGESARKLAEGLGSLLPGGAHVCGNLRDAVQKAYELAGKGSAVLFSPGFSSFGMFSGYEERGKSFEDAVLCLKNLKK